jgi:hypothetical protein
VLAVGTVHAALPDFAFEVNVAPGFSPAAFAFEFDLPSDFGTLRKV